MQQTSGRSLTAVVAGLVSAFAANICSATSLYWDGTGTAWSSVSAWSTSDSATTPNPSAVPTASDLAVFNISTVNTAQTIDLSFNASVLGLVFNNSGSTHIRTFPLLSNNLIVNASGITINPGAGPITIDTNNLSVNVSQTWTNNSANAFTVNSWVDLSNGTFANLGKTLTLDGSGDFLFTGAVYAGSTLVKNGTGTLRLTGADDDIALSLAANGGTVILDKASVATPGLFTEVHAVGSALTVGGALVQLAGTGGDQIYQSDTVNIQSGTFDMNGRNESFTALKLAGTGIGGAGALINSAATTTSTLTLDNGFGAATLTGNATVGGAGDLDLTGHLAGNFALTKVGAGSYIQSSASYTGGTTVHEGTFAIFVDSALGAATGAVTVETAGKLSVRQTITTGRLITVTGGTLEILTGKTLQITNGQLVNNGTVSGIISVSNGSVAKGTGTYDFVIVNDGGTFAPGNSPSIATVNSLQFPTAGGTLAIELGGTNPGTEYDQLHVAGALSLGGKLDVSLTGGFSPAAGNSFDILDFGTRARTFSTISLPGLTPGLAWDTSQLYINGTLSVAAIPEPKSMVLLLLATMVTTMLRGCNRQIRLAASPRR